MNLRQLKRLLGIRPRELSPEERRACEVMSHDLAALPIKFIKREERPWPFMVQEDK